MGLLIFVSFVKYKGYIGYFFATLLLSLFSITILLIMNLRLTKKKFIFPNKLEFFQIFKNLFNIGIIVYIVKILYVAWQKVGLLIAGLYLLPKEIGYINFALFLSLKTTFIPDAISVVNLPMMSKKYNEDIISFKKELKDNFSKMFVVVLFGYLAFILYSKEIISLIVGSKYFPSFSLVPFFVLSFLLYSLINLIGASVIFPALLLKEAIYYYLILCFASFSAIWLFLSLGFRSLGVAIGIFLGVVLSFVSQNIFIYIKLRFSILDARLGLLSLSLFPLLLIYFIFPNLIIKAICFLGLSYLYFSLSKRFGILDFKNIVRVGIIYKKLRQAPKII